MWTRKRVDSLSRPASLFCSRQPLQLNLPRTATGMDERRPSARCFVRAASRAARMLSCRSRRNCTTSCVRKNKPITYRNSRAPAGSSGQIRRGPRRKSNGKRIQSPKVDRERTSTGPTRSLQYCIEMSVLHHTRTPPLLFLSVPFSVCAPLST